MRLAGIRLFAENTETHLMDCLKLPNRCYKRLNARKKTGIPKRIGAWDVKGWYLGMFLFTPECEGMHIIRGTDLPPDTWEVNLTRVGIPLRTFYHDTAEKDVVPKKVHQVMQNMYFFLRKHYQNNRENGIFSN